MEQKHSMRHGVMEREIPSRTCEDKQGFCEVSKICYNVNGRATWNLHPQNFAVNSEDFRRIGTPAI